MNTNTSSNSNNNERKIKKYRPITQSYYGIYHHKKTDLPKFNSNIDQIRRRTMLLNKCSLEIGNYNNVIDNKNENKSLKQYSTIDVVNNYDFNTKNNTNNKLTRIDETTNYNSNAQIEEDRPLLKPASSETILSDSIFNSLFESLINLKSDMLLCLNNKSLFLGYFPAILLGTLLNVLNAVSYGIIIFPTELSVYKDFGPDGISMLLVSSATSQIFCAIFSVFKGACGGFMLEIIPFLHIMCKIIVDDIGIENNTTIVATTMFSYALTAVLTGVVFMLLGVFKMGFLAGFFPRHILVGCIGGVGYFLLVTSLEVASGIKLSLNLDVLRNFFELDKVFIWASCIILAICLKLMQRRINSPVLIPAFYFSIPLVFFIVISIFQISNETLVEKGWMFSAPSSNMNAPFYNYLTRYDSLNISWSTIPKLFSTMAALIFFGVLHVPINVPAVGVTIKQDNINVNQELISHGLANLITGGLGTVQNYLTYSSSVLFIKSGGTNRFAGLLMGVFIFISWILGPGLIKFLPILVIGSLIFHLGLELLKEGVYETYGVMNKVEYLTVWAIIASMALFGFVEGVFVGIILACVFFVILYSQGANPIRSICSGIQTRSTVRRNFVQRDFLNKLSCQTQVIKLQGFLFFGTINIVEKTIKNLLVNQSLWSNKPIRFLVLDLSLVSGLDFSAGEAFIRIKRLLKQKQVYFCICGVKLNSDLSVALTACGIWESEAKDPLLKTFSTLNDTLEWCENYYIERNLDKSALSNLGIAINTNNEHDSTNFDSKQETTPRTTMVNTVLNDILNSNNQTLTSNKSLQKPASLLYQIFLHEQNRDLLLKISDHFKLKNVNKGEVIWKQDQDADCLYIVSSGLLKASYFDISTKQTKQVESIIPGSMLGELAMFTKKKRTFTITAELDCELFMFDLNSFDALKNSDPILLLDFMQVALGYSALDISLYSTQAYT